MDGRGKASLLQLGASFTLEASGPIPGFAREALDAVGSNTQISDTPTQLVV